MTNRDIIAMWDEDAIVFTEEWYDGAIIGFSTEGNVIYDYYKLVEALMNHDGMTHEDAVEWVDYNMVRGAAYMGEKRPIVIYGIEDME